MDFNLVARNRAHAFEAVDLHDYDIILKYPWLQVVNPDINWPVKTWSYHIKDRIDFIKIINAETLAKNLLKKCRIFIIILYYLTSGKSITLFAATISKNCISK